MNESCAFEKKQKNLRRPRIELGSSAWKAPMLTITPATRCAQTRVYESDSIDENMCVKLEN